jgi:hypothetical protein
MTKRKKILFAIAAAFVLLLVCVSVLVPLYLNSTKVKAEIEATVSKKLGGTLSYDRIDLSLFPPSVAITKLNIGYPRTFRGSLERLSVSPRVLPLFEGKLRFAKIQITRPDFNIVLPTTTASTSSISSLVKSSPTATPATTSEAPSFEEAKQHIASLLGYLEEIGPGLDAEMDNGTFLLRRNHKDFLLLRNVAVRFNAPPGDLKLRVKASTEQWGDFSLDGTFAFSNEKSQIKTLAISMGHSSLTNISADLYWAKPPRVELRSGNASIALDEIYSWLSASESLTPFLEHVRLKRGTLLILSLQGGGPINKPDTWRRMITGKIQDVVAESHWLPASLNVSSEFRIDDNTIAVSGFSAHIGASYIDHIAGKLIDKNPPEFSITEGRASFDISELFRWRSQYTEISKLAKDIDSLTGTISLSRMQVSGPLLHPEDWQMSVEGAIRNIALTSPLLPAAAGLDGKFSVQENKVAISDTSFRLGSQSLSHVNASISNRKDPFLEIHDANATVHADELFRWRLKYPDVNALLKGVDDVAGTFAVSSLTYAGSLFHPDINKMTASGSLDRVIFSSPFLPGPVGLVKGNFRFVPDVLSFDLHEATILDSSLTGTAVLSGITTTLRSVNLTLNGSSGRNTLDWTYTKLDLPSEYMIKAPISLKGSHLTWDRKTGISFLGTITVANGLAFTLDLSQHDADLNVRKLSIKDKQTDAVFSLDWRDQVADFSYAGVMDQTTLSRIFEQGEFGSGFLRGDMRAQVHADQPLKSRIHGALTGSDIFIPWGMTIPTKVDKLSIQADGDLLTIDTADVTWGENHYSMSGAATTSDDGIAFSASLIADGIDISKIQESLEQSAKKKKPAQKIEKSTEQKPDSKTEQKTRSFPVLPVRGDLRAESAYVKFGHFLFTPAHMTMSIDPDQVGMEFYDTKTCGITIPGSVLISKESVSFGFAALAKKEKLGPTIDCLAGKELHVTGTYDFNSHISAHGNGKELLKTLDGRIDFKAVDGKIYQYPTLQKIFSVLSVLEIFRGSAPEIGSAGFAYHALTLRGDIHEGKFTIERAYLGGKSIDLIAQGEVDIAAGNMDLIVLVAPFSTLNWIIRHIPLVGDIMGGTLISFPIRVSGDIKNPDVVFLSPTAVGTRIVNLLENIIKAPVKLIAPLLPGNKKADDDD